MRNRMLYLGAHSLDVDILHVDIATRICASLLDIFLGHSVYLVPSPFMDGVLLGTLLMDRNISGR